MNPPTALIIGAGIAGIATSLRLTKLGYQVQVFESNPHTGGKLHAIKQDGYRFDLGPSLFTMPHLVDELFQLFDEEPSAYFNYIKKENLCNYFWEDGTKFQVKESLPSFINDASLVFDEPKSNIKAYLDRNKLKYDLTQELFLKKSLHKTKTYLSANTLKAIAQVNKLHLYESLDQTNQRYFTNPKLIQLFNRYATYNGSSPFQTPGIMSMISHLEMYFGTFYPVGGMHEISQSLTRFAENQGVVFHLNAEVDEIVTDTKKVNGLKVNNQFYEGDIVVSNMDIFSSYSSLLKTAIQPKKTLNQERSSSALIFYWGIKKEFPELDLHNILFSEDYQAEFEAIFNEKEIYEDPTIYINITSKEDKSDAPSAAENWFVMINVPANYGQDWLQIRKKLRKQVIAKINRILNTDLAPLIESEYVWDPVEIEKSTSSHRGSLYGASSNDQMAAFLRHPNFSKQYNNLFFCGGSVHPGGGIPLCLLSSKIVSDCVSDLKLTYA